MKVNIYLYISIMYVESSGYFPWVYDKKIQNYLYDV